MMGIKVGESQARSEVRLSQCVKRPGELRTCPSITWAQDSWELSVPIQCSEQAQRCWMERAWALSGELSVPIPVCPSIVWAHGLARAAQRTPGIVWAHKAEKKKNEVGEEKNSGSTEI